MKESDSSIGERIEVLEGLDAIRCRPDMYVGTLGRETLTLMLGEALCLPGEWASCGVDVDITIEHGELQDTCTVIDDTPGSTLEMHTGVRNIERYMTVIHACRDMKALHEAKSMCKVGIVVLNALSRHCIIHVLGATEQYITSYIRGHAQRSSVFEPTEERGHRLWFAPDFELIGYRRFDMAGVKAMLSSVVKEFPNMKVRLSEVGK